MIEDASSALLPPASFRRRISNHAIVCLSPNTTTTPAKKRRQHELLSFHCQEASADYDDDDDNLEMTMMKKETKRKRLDGITAETSSGHEQNGKRFIGKRQGGGGGEGGGDTEDSSSSSILTSPTSVRTPIGITLDDKGGHYLPMFDHATDRAIEIIRPCEKEMEMVDETSETAAVQQHLDTETTLTTTSTEWMPYCLEQEELPRAVCCKGFPCNSSYEQVEAFFQQHFSITDIVQCWFEDDTQDDAVFALVLFASVESQRKALALQNAANTKISIVAVAKAPRIDRAVWVRGLPLLGDCDDIAVEHQVREFFGSYYLEASNVIESIELTPWKDSWSKIVFGSLESKQEALKLNGVSLQESSSRLDIIPAVRYGYFTKECYDLAAYFEEGNTTTPSELEYSMETASEQVPPKKTASLGGFKESMSDVKESPGGRDEFPEVDTQEQEESLEQSWDKSSADSLCGASGHDTAPNRMTLEQLSSKAMSLLDYPCENKSAAKESPELRNESTTVCRQVPEETPAHVQSQDSSPADSSCIASELNTAPKETASEQVSPRESQRLDDSLMNNSDATESTEERNKLPEENMQGQKEASTARKCRGSSSAKSVCNVSDQEKAENPSVSGVTMGDCDHEEPSTLEIINGTDDGNDKGLPGGRIWYGNGRAPPRKGCKTVVVLNVPARATNIHLRSALERFGPICRDGITFFRSSRARNTFRCFVDFKVAEDAKYAVERGSSISILGATCRVDFYREKLQFRRNEGAVIVEETQVTKLQPSTIVVKDLDPSTTSKEVQAALRDFGRIVEDGIRIFTSRFGETTCFVPFESVESAKLVAEHEERVTIRGKECRAALCGPNSSKPAQSLRDSSSTRQTRSTHTLPGSEKRRTTHDVLAATDGCVRMETNKTVHGREVEHCSPLPAQCQKTDNGIKHSPSSGVVLHGLVPTATQKDVALAMFQFGRILFGGIRLKRTKDGLQQMAFVDFDSTEAAKKVVEHYPPIEIAGQRCHRVEFVRRSEPNRSITLFCIPPEALHADIRGALCRFGHVESIHFLCSTEKGGTWSISFEQLESARTLVEGGQGYVVISGQECRVDYSKFGGLTSKPTSSQCTAHYTAQDNRTTDCSSRNDFTGERRPPKRADGREP